VASSQPVLPPGELWVESTHVLRPISFLLLVYFVISVVILNSDIIILKISLFIFLNLSHSNSSSC